MQSLANLLCNNRSLSIMFKVGEYSEEEAKYIASHLEDAGFKVDVKSLVTARSDFITTLQGKASELRERGKITERHESFICAMKVALEKAPLEKDIRDLYMTELDPEWLAKKERINKLHSEEADEKTREELLGSLASFIVAMDFAESFLDLNDVKLGAPIGEQLDDPEVSIHVDPQEVDPEDPLLRERLEVDLEKRYEVRIDEASSALFQDVDEDFQDKYYQEYLDIMALGVVVKDLVEFPDKGKIDTEGFADRCLIDVGDEFTLSIDASQAAEEIARSLEKRGILKIKGNTIKWKH